MVTRTREEKPLPTHGVLARGEIGERETLREITKSLYDWLIYYEDLGLKAVPKMMSRDIKSKKNHHHSETLEDIRKDLGECIRCELHKKRARIVFGEGDPHARLMFIGEAPGRDEDLTGRPFVGRAGQLLTKIIEAMKLQRKEVYITNIVKCRPPNNRVPSPKEVATCEGFLHRQISVIKPKVIVCLGSVSMQNLLKTEEKISFLRGKFIEWKGIQVMPTYHPAFLLRNPDMKRAVWEDMKKVMKYLEGVKRSQK